MWMNICIWNVTTTQHVAYCCRIQFLSASEYLLVRDVGRFAWELYLHLMIDFKVVFEILRELLI